MTRLFALTFGLAIAAGALYLLGIVRRIADQDEGIVFAQKLWQARREAGDLVLQKLDDKRELYEEEAAYPRDRIRRFVDRAMTTEPSSVLKSRSH